MLRNCRRLSEMPKTQEQTLALNGASWQKLVHINWEQNCATSVLPRNSLFYNPTSPQHSIKDQSLTANVAKQQVQIEKFYCVVLLIKGMPDVDSISSCHIPAPACDFNAVPTGCRVVNGPTRSGPNPKMQARARPEPENNLKL